MLGLVCQFMGNDGRKVVNLMRERVLQLGRFRNGKYAESDIHDVYVNNSSNLAKMLRTIRRDGFKHFRVSSSLIPLMDVVPRAFWDSVSVKRALRDAGDFALKNDMRLTMHPGQFCVLSSDNDDVVRKSIVELENHAWVMDTMGLPHDQRYAINIHGGKSGRSERLIEVIGSLPSNVRSRLTLENDESSYNVIDLLEVHDATRVPIVFDSHHHTFNDGELTCDEAFAAACETWPSGIRPLQHLSNTELGLINGSFSDRRKHSEFISTIPTCQFDALKNNTIDCEIEAKAKNIAIHRLARQFGIEL